MTNTTPAVSFWSENLQQSIQVASQHGKTLLCFITDGSESSDSWEELIAGSQFHQSLQNTTVRLRLRMDTQEFGFLNAICPIQHAPALVLINGGQIEEKLESPSVSFEDLKKKLEARFISTSSAVKDESGPEAEQRVEESSAGAHECLDFAPSTGRMRLPNNAYDSLKERTDKLKKSKISPKHILALQLRLMDNISALKPYVQELRSKSVDTVPALPEDVVNRLLNTPASMLQANQASPSLTVAAPRDTHTLDTNTTPISNTAPSPPSEHNLGEIAASSDRAPTSQTQQSQRSDYLRQQRERESSQRSERDRIKAQIKADREERRRLDTIRKQGELATLRQQNSTTSSPASTDIRIQVRTFDGSTLRTTFPRTATIANDVRPWIDRTNADANKSPYDLKVILAPQPNRTVETSEEGMELPDLGIVGSATLVMVPVQGFVDSYAGASTGVAGTVIGGLIGAGGSVVNGVLGMLGWGGPPASTSQGQQQQATSATNAGSSLAGDAGSSSSSQVKVRTLADQRAEEAKKRGNQLYNGNSLDFQGRKDENDRKQD